MNSTSLSSEYRVSDQLGLGPDGVAYRAERIDDGTAVELRVLNGVEADAGRVEYLTRRLHLAKLLQHPAAIQIFAVMTTHPLTVVVEPRGALSLRQHVAQLGPAERLRLVLDVARVVADAHRVGLSHGQLDWDEIRFQPECGQLQVDFTGQRTRTDVMSGAPAIDSAGSVTNGAAGDDATLWETPEVESSVFCHITQAAQSDVVQLARLLTSIWHDGNFDALPDAKDSRQDPSGRSTIHEGRGLRTNADDLPLADRESSSRSRLLSSPISTLAGPTQLQALEEWLAGVGSTNQTCSRSAQDLVAILQEILPVDPPSPTSCGAATDGRSSPSTMKPEDTSGTRREASSRSDKTLVFNRDSHGESERTHGDDAAPNDTHSSRQTGVEGEAVGDDMSGRRDGRLLPESIKRQRSVLGRYRLLEKIGAGGMGAVFRAEDQADGQHVALKVLASSAFENSRARLRFLKEARLLSEIDSPYVVRLLEQNEDNGLLFLALELIEGTDLKDYLVWSGRLEERRALRIAADIARGLSSAHELGIIHRDVKPGNVLLAGVSADQSQASLDMSTSVADSAADSSSADSARASMDDPPAGHSERQSTNRVKLTDFGLARHIDQTASLQVTQVDAVLGTPTYMSPEQCGEQHELSPATDIYSLGVTLYEMLAGQPPFVGDVMDVAASHRTQTPPSLTKIRDDLSQATLGLVERMLAKDPGERFLDAAHFLESVEPILRGETTEISRHPVLPEVDERQLFRADFQWDLQATPAELWPFVSNTERINCAVGVPAVEYATERDETLGIRKFGKFQMAGMKIGWEEHPFEWVEGQRLGVLRTFDQGPFRWFLSIVETEPTATGTRLKHSVRISPRGFVGRGVAHLEVNLKGKRALDRVYRRIDQVVRGTLEQAIPPDPFEPPSRVAKTVQRRLTDGTLRLAQRGADPKVVECIAQVLAYSPAQQLARIRPKQLARENGLDLDAVLEGCLLAASEGLFHLHWDVLCPTCRVSSSVQAALREIRAHANCEFCDADFEVDFGKSIELVFQASPQIRAADVKTYCIGGPEHAPHVVCQLRLAAGERMEVNTQLTPGRYVWRGPQLPYNIPVHVRSTRGAGRAEVVFAPRQVEQQLDRRAETSSEPQVGRFGEVRLRSGGQLMALTNDSPTPLLVRLERTVHRDDVVTAAEAACRPLFQQLFPNECLRPGELVHLGAATFLAVRFESVAALCRDLGDATAYDLFASVADSIRAVVRRHGGVVVRNTFEQFLATFDEPIEATHAALALVQELADGFLADRLLPKLAVHSGETLILARDDRTDYFGCSVQTSLALALHGTPGKIALSETVATLRDVAAWLSNRQCVVRVVVDESTGQRIYEVEDGAFGPV